MSLLPFLRHSSSYGREGSGLGDGYGQAKRLSRTNLLNSGGQIVPRVEAWPWSADQNGQSFPGGLVGVRFNYNPTPGSDPTTFNKAYLMAVPATLPAAYTLRASRDINRGAFPSSNQTKGLSFPFRLNTTTLVANAFGWDASAGFTPVRIRIVNALTDYLWMPECVADQCTVAATTSRSPLWTGAPVCGLRYFRLQAYPFGSFSTSRKWIRMRVSYNADSSKGLDGSSSFPFFGTIGDTILFEQVTHWDGSASFPAYDTGFLSGYNCPTFGKRAYFCFSIDVFEQVTPGGTPAESDWDKLSGIQAISWGPRVDIPFPWTFTGLSDAGGHLVAPGGVVPGSLPGF